MRSSWSAPCAPASRPGSRKSTSPPARRSAARNPATGTAATCANGAPRPPAGSSPAAWTTRAATLESAPAARRSDAPAIAPNKNGGASGSAGSSGSNAALNAQGRLGRHIFVTQRVGDSFVGHLAGMDVEAVQQVHVVGQRLVDALVGQRHGEGQGGVVERDG